MQPANHILTSKKGFTLIELLVVIAILGILATISFALLNPAVLFGQTRDVRRKSDLKEIAKALQLYYGDNKKYPSSNITPFAKTDDLFGNGKPLALVPAYIKFLPTDPKNSSSNVYTYRSNLSSEGTCGADQDYVLRAILERTTDPQATPQVSAAPNWCGSINAVEASPAAGSYYVTPN